MHERRPKKSVMIKYILPALMSLYSAAALAGVQSLMDVYRLAQGSDPSWAAAQNAHVAAQEKLVQGKALTLPTVTLDADANHSNTDVRFRGRSSVFGNGDRQSFETYGYSLNLNHPLYRKQNSIQYEQARTQVAQADEVLNDARQDLMLRVSEAYFQVLLAQDQINLIDAQKAAISKQLEQAKVTFEVGTTTITDVHEAQARYDLILAQEIAALNDLEAKKRAIQSLTGELPDRLASARDDLSVTIPQPQNMEDWVALAEQNTPALKIQQQSLNLAEQEIERTKAGHLPTLDAIASYSDSRANGGTNGFGSDLKNMTVGVQFQLPLYQGGAITSRQREAVANREKALDDLEAVRRQAGLATRQAYLSLTSSVAQVRAFEQALVSSQSQLDSTSLGYEVGVRTTVDVLNAQQQLYTAKRDLLQARYAYLLNIIRLKAAAGVLAEGDIDQVNSMLMGV